MNILIATGIYPPDIGGPATFAEIVAREFKKQGHGVKIVTYGMRKKIDDGDVVVISRAIPKLFRHIVYFFSIIKWGRSSDVVLVLDVVSAGIPTVCAASFIKKKFILRVVGDYAWEQGMQRFGVRELLDDFLQKKYGWHVSLLRRLQTYVAQKATRIIVPSKYLQRVVLKWGINLNSIVIVPNSVEMHCNTSKEDARRKLNLDGVVLLSAGRLVPWKGFSMLIEAVAELVVSRPIKLVIIGEGPDKEVLEGLRNRLKLSQSVVFPGAVSKELLGQYMAASDVFLLNTAYEGFSHQIIEAMASGIPVITTHAGGNAEIIIDNDNALVALFNNKQSWKEAIQKMLDDEALRRHIVHQAKEFSNMFTKDRMVGTLIEEIKKI